jgi:hypothetical protein
VARTVRFDVLAVAKATGFDEADRKIQHLSGTAKKSTSGLLVAAAALAPAMIPIAAAATAAGASFVALGATGLLAFQGIKKEMAAGTPIGKQYAASIGTLKADLTSLERTAAGGVLTGFQKSVLAIQPLMPTLNADTAQLSSKLGDIVSHVMPGLVALFTTAQPLLLGFADDLDKGAAGFEHWAQSSDGAKKFVAYAQAELPKVEEFIGSLATTVGHLAQGFAPFGGFILSDLTAFSKVINAIPVPVLKVAAPAVLSLVVAMKAMAVASATASGIIKLNSALLGFAAAETTVGAASLSLVRYLGPLAIAIGTVVAAGKGLEVVSQKFDKGTFMHDVLDPHNADILKVQGSGIDALRGAYEQAHDGIEGTAQQLLDWGSKSANATIVTKQHYVSVKELDKALADLRSQLGPTSGAVTTLLGAQVKAGITIDGVTTTIGAQTTAAGLLKNALDRLNGATVSVEDTQNQFLDTLGQLKKAHDAGTRSIDQNSAKGRVNREVLVAAIKAANDHAQAVANETAKTHGLAAGVRAGSADFAAHEEAIKRAAHAAGLDEAAVAALIAKLGKVPRAVVTALSIRDKASSQIATIKANLAALKSKQIDITTYVKNVILPTVRGPSAGERHHASGGSVQDGWFTSGEQGYELGYKQGSQVQFFSHAQSVAITGMSHVPGYAAGTTGTAGLSGSVFARLRADIAGLARALGSVSLLGPAANKAVTAVGKILPGVGTVESGLNAENRALQIDVARRGRLADQLKVANQRLADARRTLAEKASSVAQGLLSGFDLSQFVGTGGPAQFSVPTILDAAKAFADRMVQFRAQIRLLQKEGLNKTLLDQLAQQGPSAQADALAQATRSQIRALNLQYRRAGVTAAAIGGLDAKSLYGAGVAAARGIVAGLRSQETALDKQMERLGRILVRALNRALGIHSPARATMPAGKFAVLGLVKGIDDNVHHATAAADRLGAAAIPANGSYPSKMTGGGSPIYITINAGAIANPVEFRRLLIGELERAFAAGETVTGGQRAMR